MKFQIEIFSLLFIDMQNNYSFILYEYICIMKKYFQIVFFLYFKQFYIFKFFFFLLGGIVDIIVYKKVDDGILEELIFVFGGFLGGIFVDKEYEKFLEKIGGEGILWLFVRINMEDYLNLFRDFEFKKCEVRMDLKLRIKFLLVFDGYVKERNLVGINKVF